MKAKKKTIKLNDLSQLGSVISFKQVDDRAYDAKYISTAQVVKDFLKQEQGQKAFDKLNKK